MRLPLLTLGVLCCFSLNLGPLGDLGFDAATFGVVLGAAVKLDFDEEEEFCEVGSRPFFDGLRQSFRNHKRIFTSLSLAQAAFPVVGRIAELPYCNPCRFSSPRNR